MSSGDVQQLDDELRLALEAILMVVEEPVPADALAQVLETDAQQVVATLRMLRREYLDHGHGFVLREVAGGWRIYTAPQAAAYVERWVTHGRSGALSRAALETLAIIAYRQPVTRAAISDIRGVDADGAVRTLLARGLVESAGRADTPGQPVLYVTTTTFLEQLGVGAIDDLPALSVFAPPGPPPEEPAAGDYKAARRTLARTTPSQLAADGDLPGDRALPGNGALRRDGALPRDGDVPGNGAPPRNDDLPGNGDVPGNGALPRDGDLPGNGDLPADAEGRW